MGPASSSIFSSSAEILRWVLANFGRLSTTAWLHTVAASAVLILAALLVRRLRPSWRPAVTLGIAILALRLVLFGNPASWTAYSKLLDEFDVGRRQNAAILLQARHYLAYPEPVEYLAVGSSQTYALYGRRAGREANLDIFSMPGMGPLDYVLYRHRIAERKPRKILLFLSASDVAAGLSYNAMRMVPGPGLYWFRLLPRLLAARQFKSAEGTLADMLAADLLPEYKNAYVLRGLVGKLVGEQEALGTELLPELPDAERLEANIHGLTSTLDARNIPLQLSFVRDFAAFCRQRGIALVIVEGQYHPRAVTQENRVLNATVRAELFALAKADPNITFVPREATVLFEAGDYRDGLHVLPEAADRFTADLFTKLDDGVR